MHKCVCGSEMTKIKYFREVSSYTSMMGLGRWFTPKLRVEYEEKKFFASKECCEIKPEIYFCEKCGRIDKILTQNEIAEIKRIEKLFEDGIVSFVI